MSGLRREAASLNEASAPMLGFSASLTRPFIRRMVFGGQDVAGGANSGRSGLRLALTLHSCWMGAFTHRHF
jgi:hypothetical protein